MLNVLAETGGVRGNVTARQNARANAPAIRQVQMRVNGGRGRAAYRTDQRRVNTGSLGRGRAGAAGIVTGENGVRATYRSARTGRMVTRRLGLRQLDQNAVLN